MTERTRLQEWVDGLEVPGAYDAAFLDRVRRRRRVRAARAGALALTTAAGLAVAATLVPWQGRVTTSPPAVTVRPSPGPACGFETDDGPAVTPEGVALTIELPARVKSGAHPRIGAVLTNTGDRPVAVEVVGDIRICTVRTDDGTVDLSGMLGPNGSERSFDLGPGRKVHFEYPWIGGICPTDQAGKQVCNPGGGLIATGVYRAYAALQVRRGDVVSYLSTASTGTISIVD